LFSTFLFFTSNSRSKLINHKARNKRSTCKPVRWLTFLKPITNYRIFLPWFSPISETPSIFRRWPVFDYLPFFYENLGNEWSCKSSKRSCHEQTPVTNWLSQGTAMAFVKIAYKNSYTNLHKNKMHIHYKDEVVNSEIVKLSHDRPGQTRRALGDWSSQNF